MHLHCFNFNQDFNVSRDVDVYTWDGSRVKAGKARGLKIGKEDVEKYDCQRLFEYLLVAEAFQANLINGEAFLELSEEDLKELLPVIGDRILVRKPLKKLHEVLNY